MSDGLTINDGKELGLPSHMELSKNLNLGVRKEATWSTITVLVTALVGVLLAASGGGLVYFTMANSLGYTSIVFMLGAGFEASALGFLIATAVLAVKFTK